MSDWIDKKDRLPPGDFILEVKMRDGQVIKKVRYIYETGFWVESNGQIILSFNIESWKLKERL